MAPKAYTLRKTEEWKGAVTKAKGKQTKRRRTTVTTQKKHNHQTSANHSKRKKRRDDEACSRRREEVGRLTLETIRKDGGIKIPASLEMPISRSVRNTCECSRFIFDYPHKVVLQSRDKQCFPLENNIIPFLPNQITKAIEREPRNPMVEILTEEQPDRPGKVVHPWPRFPR